MSLLDLLYLEESKSDAVIAAVRQWCFRRGCDISDDHGRQAMSIAVQLAKSDGASSTDFLKALSNAMVAATRPTQVKTVLIVEDEPLIAMDMEAVLQSVGLAVDHCASRADALKLLTSKTPMAAILDFQLKDGEVTDIALELDLRDVPVIFCSGLHANDIPSGLCDANWLHKPFDDQQLLYAVKALLEPNTFRQQKEQRA